MPYEYESTNTPDVIDNPNIIDNQNIPHGSSHGSNVTNRAMRLGP